MQTDHDIGYTALVSRDARFDGRIFVGVATTGIYCRPVCPVRKPKKANCTFYPSAAAAEAAGFRPCLRCRPEEAPGNATIDRADRLAWIAAHAIEEDGTGELSLERLAGTLGVTPRHLRRVFFRTFGVPPVRYAQTQRLLLARRMLAGSDLSVLDVAMTAGFGSVRRLNELFQSRYKTTPSSMRRSKDGHRPEVLVFELGYRPPYAWDRIAAFLANRALDGVERAAVLTGGRSSFRAEIRSIPAGFPSNRPEAGMPFGSPCPGRWRPSSRAFWHAFAAFSTSSATRWRSGRSSAPWRIVCPGFGFRACSTVSRWPCAQSSGSRFPCPERRRLRGA